MRKQQMSEKEISRLIKQLNLDELDGGLKADKTGEGQEHLEHEHHPFKEDGSVQVKDHIIVVRDPVNGGRRPVISAIPPVKLFINGEYIETECQVSSTDRIHWEIHEDTLFHIQVTEDRLNAYFHLKSKERYAWQLLNTEPLSHLIVTAEEDKGIVLETVHLSDVAAQLERKSIKSNVDLASIQQELLQPTYRPIAVAKGKAAVPGRDAQLDIYFSEQLESQFFEISGTIDFRNHLQIPSVKQGDVIARKIPMVDGIPGYDVYGEVIMPAPPKDVFVVVKSGVELTPDGKIIARKEGRPRITGSHIKTFDISTSFIVSGDVNIETGNIVFSGDVIVYGNVTDNMIIESLGNVYIYGSVFHATITATGSIHIRGNVIGSKLYSGYYGVMFNRLYNASKLLGEHIEKLIAAAGMLEQALESKRQVVRYGQIAQLLIESKLKDIPAAAKELLSVISNIQHIRNSEYQKLIEMITIFFQPARMLDTATYGYFQSLLTLLHETHEEVARMQEAKVQTIINQCHNSELKTNGDIIIRLDGVILSNLYSAGSILFQSKSAVCRGARLEAEGVISAKIVGGETGAKTLLKAKKEVKVKRLYEGRICVGGYCTDIYEIIENKSFTIHELKRRAKVSPH